MSEPLATYTIGNVIKVTFPARPSTLDGRSSMASYTVELTATLPRIPVTEQLLLLPARKLKPSDDK